MAKSNIKEAVIQLLQLIAVFVVLTFTRNEIIFTLVIAALLLVNFKIKYNKNEWGLFFIGCLAGFIIEIALGKIYRMQYWQQDSLFGVPVWLPLLWGYGFVFIRRIGNLIVKD